MSYEFKLPDIGEGITEGEIIKWHVKEGDEVKEDQPLLEIMTDKVNAVIPSPVKGKVTKILAKEGEKVRVGQTLLLIEGVETAVSQPAETTQPIQAPQKEEKVVEQEAQRVLASPAVRKLARELGVDLSKIKGSGPAGRITESDVRAYAETLKSVQPQETKLIQKEALEERVPVRGIRRSVAEKMVKSAYTAPHVTHFDEIDATTLVKLREFFKNAAELKGLRLTYLPFIIKAVCAALKEFPYLNASFDQERNEIVLKKYYNIGIATAVEGGLVVPVVKDADKKNLFEIASEITRLTEAARQNKLTLSDVQGGTFSITNIGSIGGLFATPIINYPEVAILGVYKIYKKVVYTEGKIEPRDYMNVSLTFDHRVLDGAVAASFTNRLKQILEDEKLLLSLLF
ncbi:branched-chain alpha-keto acid dehydrogenase subunit E2 [Candidatus Marsarchaeota G2 archaeon ECH_B_SAG-G16]|jgi:Pyruvate/2-oxoglutarate dehydrogenase complex, dihydrolipoamide acyltransferase (E2) component, and related enzymes|uniref:dihydrolipoyllysine-residue (2-methylpropanoyl)transferase n=4 Tax=Candidatus Marsarchaeota TaxID=1978152 RepID=A0A2R6AJJ1_9ARCH|nr:MAG: branched-chain alpha-keto acid dehydrogenase subunit E2 [Candidatus Marsarchaeota G1 archaeon OSP_D]PSN86518.1 MAG: branched-chain alpha-keto acid dehydrogenase subunit E2 [Candidatus Marsarchaeota G1 archaeon BE_D]PSN89212.1 MAG: branched-chain alpha-keto acid dehydrogenase subunit E2 [Candidatus Marsarchaeota G1 archaeon OSP_C]PSO05305.1 MAG: branched-chain alpha-keto acid dehydrogenase subunit E2 [Candidatus Marsarchaeota G2 archaeon ECH_B_SAG-G16]